MGVLEGNLSRNSDGSTFGASAVGWSPLDDFIVANPEPKPVPLMNSSSRYHQFGDPAYDDEHYLKSRGVW